MRKNCQFDIFVAKNAQECRFDIFVAKNAQKIVDLIAKMGKIKKTRAEK